MAELIRDQCCDGRSNVLGKHLALEQHALCVEGSQILFWYSVDGRTLGTPAAGEDAAPRTTASGFTPLTRMPYSPSSAAKSRTWWAWSAFAAP